MKTETAGKHAAQQARKQGMEAKSKKFVDIGAEVYVK